MCPESLSALHGLCLLWSSVIFLATCAGFMSFFSPHLTSPGSGPGAHHPLNLYFHLSACCGPQ